MGTIDTLKAARKHLENPEHWFKGDWQDPVIQDCVCAAGAVAIVLNGPDVFDDMNKKLGTQAVELINKLHGLAKKVSNGKYENVAAYNDAKETTHEDILKFFDLAIEYAEVWTTL